MTDIRIRITEQDDKTLFTGKELGVENRSIHTPHKLFDLNNLQNVSTLESLNPEYLRTVQIIERSRILHQRTYLQEAEHPDARFLTESYDIYKRNPSLQDKLIVNSLTLSFNPFDMGDAEEYLRSILHIYHGRSDLLLIPNLKIRRYDERQRSEIQVEREEFTRYVNLAHQILDFRNSKPIFVPIPTKYGSKSFRSFVSGFIQRGYRYFWIDFEGSSIISRLPHIRSFHDIIDAEHLENEVILYGSNIRRENNPHLSEPRCPASDILMAPLGIDIIGVNREPQRGGGDPGDRRPYIPPPAEEVINHKARFLDREDYTYVKYSLFPHTRELLDKYHVDETLIRKNPRFYSNYVNTFEINEELRYHQALITENESLLGYLGTKNSIHPRLLKAFKKEVGRDTPRQISLDSFFE